MVILAEGYQVLIDLTDRLTVPIQVYGGPQDLSGTEEGRELLESGSWSQQVSVCASLHYESVSTDHPPTDSYSYLQFSTSPALAHNYIVRSSYEVRYFII